jgi:hypothetical protein
VCIICATLLHLPGIHMYGGDAQAGSRVTVHAGTLVRDRPLHLGCVDMGFPNDGLLPKDGASRLQDSGVGRASIRLSSRHLGLKVLHQRLTSHLSCFALGTKKAYGRAYKLLICTFHIQLVPIWCFGDSRLLRRVVYGDYVDMLWGFSHGVSPLFNYLGNGRLLISTVWAGTIYNQTCLNVIAHRVVAVGNC